MFVKMWYNKNKHKKGGDHMKKIIDKHGRIGLPTILLELAKLTRESKVDVSFDGKNIIIKKLEVKEEK